MSAPDAGAGPAAAAEEVLAAHSVEDYSEGEYDGDASLLCACHFVARGSDLYDAGFKHRAHVAAQLAAAGLLADPAATDAAAAQAWDEALDEVERAVGRAFSGDEYEENCEAASGEAEWSWWKWLGLETVRAVRDAAEPEPATGPATGVRDGE